VVTTGGTVTTSLTGTGISPDAVPAPSPPGAPRTVGATAGDSTAVVTWEAPAHAGSYDVSHYYVIADPGGESCQVAAPVRQCAITGLRNGVAYTFRVRALNGAGWGTYSVPSDAVTPQASPTPTIVISGGRDTMVPRRVRVSGTALSLDDTAVLPHFRFPGMSTYRAGVRGVALDDAGSFTWVRRTSREITVYFTAGAIRSNEVRIPKRVP
jgi:hypothetical protein